MSDDQPIKSPAPKWIRTAVAGVFVAVWLIVILVDFFYNRGETVIPFWFQATGLIVLGYLLGVSMDDITGGMRSGGR